MKAVFNMKLKKTSYHFNTFIFDDYRCCDSGTVVIFVRIVVVHSEIKEVPCKYVMNEFVSLFLSLP